MQTATDISRVFAYAFDLSHHSDGWVIPFGSAIAEVPFEAAIWKPGGSAASIAEVAAHALNYLERLNRDLVGESRVEFEDWPGEAPTECEWESLKSRVTSAQKEARAKIATLTQDRLFGPDSRRGDPLYESILDIAIHDAYHSGQIVKLMQIWSDR